jgi:epoxide hydrolase 4
MKMIFLHGFPDSPEVWSHQISAFSDKYECIAPKLHSKKFDEQIKVIYELTEGEEVILIAHDMGGPVVTDFAGLYPELVKRVILINTMGLTMFAQRMRKFEQILRTSYMSVFINPLVTTRTLRPFTKKILSLIYNSGKLSETDPLREGLPEVFDGLSLYKELLWKMPKRLFEPEGPLAVPVDFIFGTQDPFFVLPTQKEVIRYFQRVSIHTIETGHWPMRTASDEVNQKISEILS